MTMLQVTKDDGWLARFLISTPFEFFIMALIVANAAVLGLETVPAYRAQFGSALEAFNTFVLGVFVIEILLKMYAFGHRFWRDGWCWFDMAIVGVSLAPAAGGFAALRALRALRILRLITFVPSLRRVVEGLIKAIPGLGSICLLLLLLLYVAALIANKMFGQTHPDFFGTLGASSFTLFTVMTLEGWPDVARSVMEQHPLAWVFFVCFIMVSSFAVLNLIIGVIVDAMQTHSDLDAERIESFVDREQDEVMGELKALRTEIATLKEALAAHQADIRRL